MGGRGRRRARRRERARVDRRCPRARRRARRSAGRVAAARRRASARLARVRALERVVPRVARDRRAARGDRADGRLARASLLHDLELLDAPRTADRCRRWRRSRCRRPTRSPRAASAIARRRGACGLRLVVARKPGAGGDQARAARPGRRAAIADALGASDSGGRRDARSTLADDDLSTFAPGLALASARHETQYTRLFRS